MPKHFLSYWKPTTAKRVRERNGDSDLIHSASNQYGRVSPGDSVWIVSQIEGDLCLLARIIVAKVTGYEEARAYFDDEFIWEADHHILAKEDTAGPIRPVSLAGEVRQLRFVGKNDRLLVADDGTMNPQQLQTMRQLTQSTADLLNRLWTEHGDESNPPVDEETMEAQGKERPLPDQSEQEIKPTRVKYIKLGGGGEWEQECIETMHTLRLGFVEEKHALCLAGNWEAIKRHFRRQGHNPSTSSRMANEIREFYEANETVLWITFYDHKMWWCFSEPVITLMPDNTKTRPAIGRWRCDSISGKPLDFDHLSKDLVKKRMYKGKICGVADYEYVVNTINGRGVGTGLIPEEVEAPEKYLEGAVRTIYVNAYERSRDARSKCIEYYGWACAVCGYNMADLYGDLGDEIIHVHHLRELASLGKEYEVDPIKDLRPVCPNCHSILHTCSPVMTIEKLRKILLERKPVRWPTKSK